MKKKGNFRKVVSGLLAGMTMLSTVLSPMTAYAAEIQPEEKPPLYEEVKDLLDEDEVVTAKDYEIETGSVFNVKSDYTGLEIKDDNKVKVTFEEATLTKLAHQLSCLSGCILSPSHCLSAGPPHMTT